MSKTKKDTFNPYCSKCGGCGYIGCDGIESFLNEHIKGKTNCKNEESFIQEIIWCCETEKHHSASPKKSNI